MENIGMISSLNCLCKLKNFTIYLRELILERSEWHVHEGDNWPLLHDLIGITTLSCLKNEDFKFLKRTAFSWSKYDKEVSLKDFRLVNGQILICTRLNGFTKFINIFVVDCIDGEIHLSGQVHSSDEEEHFDCYELKTAVNISGSIHFAPCGGYFLGRPVYLQYDVPRLLKSIYKVIDPIKKYITQNWQYKRIIQYITHIPEIISETIFGGNAKTDGKELDEVNDGKFKPRHTNPENLMFLSPEMCEAQKHSGLILFHYRDNEVMKVPDKSLLEADTSNKKKKYKEYEKLRLPYIFNKEFELRDRLSATVLENVNYLSNNMNHFVLDYEKKKVIYKFNTKRDI